MIFSSPLRIRETVIGPTPAISAIAALLNRAYSRLVGLSVDVFIDDQITVNAFRDMLR